MRTQWPFALLLCGATAIASAQTTADSSEAFSVAAYKPARYKVQSLVFSPSLDFNAGGRRDSTKVVTNAETEMSGYGGGNGSYRFRNHRVMSDLELSTDVSLQGRGVRFTSEGYHPGYDSMEQRRGSFPGIHYGVNQHIRYRRYVKGRLFVEAEANPSVQHMPQSIDRRTMSCVSEYGYDSTGRQIHRFQYSEEIDSTHSLWLSSSASGAVGTGWIAPVTSAAIVLHMIDAIGRATGSSAAVSDAQKRQWAALLDRLQRRRVFDGRLAVIETMDSITAYLRSERIIEKETARLTMELHDIWAYGYWQERRSGSEVKCSPIAYASVARVRSSVGHAMLDTFVYEDPNVPSTVVQDPSWYEQRRIFLTYGGRIYAGYSKPYGRQFEVDASAECAGTITTVNDSMRTATVNKRFSSTYPNVAGKTNLALRWFPSLRSTVSLRGNLQLSHDFAYRYLALDDETGGTYPEISETKTLVDASASVYTEYYFSPRLSYTLYGALSYRNGSRRYDNTFSQTPKIHDLHFNVGAYLSYALF